MVRYFYAWPLLPFVVTVVILALPWLGVLAFIVALLVAVAALGALAWAVVWAVQALVRSVPRRPRGKVTQTDGLR
jgi:hypothetical protein